MMAAFFMPAKDKLQEHKATKPYLHSHCLLTQKPTLLKTSIENRSQQQSCSYQLILNSQGSSL
jgi:hypothetical protein